MKKVLMLIVVSAFAISVPAAAKSTHSHPAHPSTSKKCTSHGVAYSASGTFVSWTATKDSNGRYNGTITVDVTKTNHHAKGDKGTEVTYTLSGAKVVFGHGANPPAGGDRVRVTGKITEFQKKCDQTGFSPTTTIRQVVIHTAHKAG